MSDYAPFDQEKHLGERPWDEEALRAWEEAHGHDARVKCLPEYGCLTYYSEWERLIDEVDQLETEVERLREKNREEYDRNIDTLNAVLANADPDEWDRDQSIDSIAVEYVRHVEGDRDRYREALEEASSFAKWCWNQAKRLTALNSGSPAFDRLRDEGRRVYRLTRAALDGDDQHEPMTCGQPGIRCRVLDVSHPNMVRIPRDDEDAELINDETTFEGSLRRYRKHHPDVWDDTVTHCRECGELWPCQAALDGDR